VFNSFDHGSGLAVTQPDQIMMPQRKRKFFPMSPPSERQERLQELFNKSVQIERLPNDDKGFSTTGRFLDNPAARYKL